MPRAEIDDAQNSRREPVGLVRQPSFFNGRLDILRNMQIRPQRNRDDFLTRRRLVLRAINIYSGLLAGAIDG